MHQIAENIWLIDGGIVDFHGFAYPTRAVVVRMAEGGLWVWSPVALDAALRGEIDALGPVAHLVSPNKLHHLFLHEWREAYPDAVLWGPASTIRRHPGWAFGPALGDAPPSAWGGEFAQAWFRGSVAMDEVVFFHRPSRTVMVADLIQSFDPAFLRAHWRWWQRPFAWLGGIVAGRDGTPLDWRMTFWNRARTREALEAVLSWETERIVIAHGRWCQSNGRDFLRRALAWI